MEDDDLQLVRKCCSLAFRAHDSDAHFVKDNSVGSQPIFAFQGSRSVDHWFYGDQFSKSKPYPTYFPSLKALGSGDSGILNLALLQRFDQILLDSQSRLPNEADRTRKKKIVFTGLSNGGAAAILATIWLLETHRRDPKPDVLCITFGAPLVGDKIVGHAIRREGWSSCFRNFVFPRDPIPRIHFCPRDEIAGDLPSVLLSRVAVNPGGSTPRTLSSASETNQFSEKLFDVVFSSAFSIASYDSCVLRSSAGGGCLLAAVNGLVKLSPYRPFGIFYFCCSEGEVVKVENHEAVTQILFHSLLLEGSSSGSNGYQTYDIKKIVPLDNLQTIPLSANDKDDDVNSGPNILDLDMDARLNLIAAGDMEQARKKNLATVNGYKHDINACLSKLQTYCTNCDDGIGYYDAFKLQQHKADFEANVTRLELVGHWEEVRELVKGFELPDSFETNREWVDLGTRIRVLVEPIDIANFYRHDKNEETNLYKADSRARPNYYRYPENWLRHMRGLVPEADPLWGKEWNLDSCFWARVENMCIGIKKKGFDSEKGTVLEFEKEVEKWLTEGALSERELKRPTFHKWWGMLPEEHKNNSRIRDRMVDEARPANPTVPN
ncbi:hypothetical protein EJ110_NYTH01619 [Nymphaea thermarum]|nr:hypothetical protein EJ110_NYTH01619 [Nymphaea thermarum]